MSLPVVVFDRLYHVGTLNAADRGRQWATSQEGACLSVSNCPWAWAEIARLGGQPLHQMSHEQGRPILLLDLLAVRDDANLFATCKAWAMAEGLVEDRTLWRAWQEDEEGESFFLLCASRAAAIDEVDDPERVEPAIVLAGTPRLSALALQGDLSSEDATDFAIMAWAEYVLVQRDGRPFDGVWWDSAHAPERLSAPKGAIFNNRLSAFRAETIDWDLAPEEPELPKAKLRLPDLPVFPAELTPR